MRKITLLGLLFFFYLGLMSQSEILYKAGHKLKKYGVKDGVTKSEVVGIIEDRNGYLWFTNVDYLIKYDGYQFKKYKPKKDQLLKGSANYKKHLLEDKDGYIWVSTFGDGGLLRFNPIQETFERIRNDNTIVGGEMVLDKNGYIWLGGQNGFHKIKTQGDTYSIERYAPQSLSSDRANQINDILEKTDAVFQQIDKVGNLANRQESFSLEHSTELGVLVVGEFYGTRPSDFGWIQTQSGIQVWNFDAAPNYHAGGAFKNFIQVDTITLPAGKYQLHYQSDESHAYNNWNETPPNVNNWGIHLLHTREIEDTKLLSLLPQDTIYGLEAVRNIRPFLAENGDLFFNASEGIFKVNLLASGQPQLKKYQEKLTGFVNKGIYTGKSGLTYIPTSLVNENKEVEIRLYGFDSEQNTLKLIKHGLPEGSFEPGRGGGIINIEEDHIGNLWVGTWGNGLFKLAPPFLEVSDALNEPNITYIDLGHEMMGGEYRGFIRGLKIDSKNNLWIGTRLQHLYQLSLRESEVSVVNIRKKIGLSDETKLTAPFEDQDKQLWTSAIPYKGLIKYNLKSGQFKHYKDNFFGFKEKAFVMLHQDTAKKMWLGANYHLLKFNPNTEKIQQFPLPRIANITENYVYETVNDYQGKTWVRTQGGGLYLFNENARKFIPVISENYYDFNQYVTDIIVDKDKGIWIMQANGYGPLMHVDWTDSKLDTFFQTSLESYCMKIIQDPQGIVWAANGIGLSAIDTKKDTILLFAEEEGLTNNRIVDLQFDKDDNIWVSTSTTIEKFDKKTKRFLHYRNLEDINLEDDLIIGNFIKNSKGEFKILAKNGFYSFYPEKLTKSKIVPTVIINAIKASNKSVLATNNWHSFSTIPLKLDFFQNDLSIDYIGINFDDAPKQQYQYQLEGINENWVNAGTERTARFPNLPAGNYTFNVKAANADGIWSEPKSLNITILPPWWKTWWAYLIYTLSIIGLLVYWYSTLQQKIKTKEALLVKEKAFSNKLERINTANQRFVPNDFLQILGKKSIEDLKLGDQTQTKMTVLFSDIRDYTPLSESMTPEENFKFINAYLGRVGPIIKAHGGFISTYLGDGFMALFVNEPENALKAAIAAQKELENYNRERKTTGKRWLKTGMGLNTGELMLGVIGDEHRYESTVISDAVNTASRMEGLTKIFGAAIILSERTLLELLVSDTSKVSDTLGSAPKNVSDTSKVSDTFAYRYLGKVKVKGKDKALKIYDLYEGEPIAIRQLKAKTHILFEQGIGHYYKKEFGKAAECFKQVLAINEEDKAAQYYLDKSVAFIVNGVKEDWSGVEEMLLK